MACESAIAGDGHETKEMRSLIPAIVAAILDQTCMGDAYRSENLDRALGAGAEPFYQKMRHLEPRDDFQRALYAQTLQIGMELGQNRSLLLEETGGHSRTLPGHAGFLARADFRKLWSVRTYQLDRNRDSLRLRAVSCRGYFPNPGIRSAVPGDTSDFEHTATRCAHAS
jgi:hypothetical protein